MRRSSPDSSSTSTAVTWLADRCRLERHRRSQTGSGKRSCDGPGRRPSRHPLLLCAWVVEPGQLSVGVEASEQGVADLAQLLELRGGERVDDAVADGRDVSRRGGYDD